MTLAAASVPFSKQEEGVLYLTEGGTETEVMYRHGHELREFAMFELMHNPAAVNDLRDMYRRYLDVAAKHGFAALMAGFDYRLSPDWGKKLGYSDEALREMQHLCIDFLREVSRPYIGQLPRIVICGCVGPRGDAYSLNKEVTAESAEQYHSWQMEVLAECDVDLVWAATINNIPEAVGLAKAAARAKLPINICWTLTSDHRLRSGPTVKDAVETTDNLAGIARPDSYGINCSHPVEFEPALDDGAWVNRLRMFRPNAAKMDKVALCKIGHIEEGDPDELGEMMGALARRFPGVDMWGGCCGTWDKHFDKIASAVRMARSS